MGSEGCKGPDPAVMNLKTTGKYSLQLWHKAVAASISVNDFPAEKWYSCQCPGHCPGKSCGITKSILTPITEKILNQFPGIRLAAGSQWIRKVPSILHGGTVPVLRYLQSGKDRT